MLLWEKILIRSIFFFNDTATTEIYTLSLHDALPIYIGRTLPRRRALACSTARRSTSPRGAVRTSNGATRCLRSEEHTSELQSRQYLVCCLLLEKKKIMLSSHSTDIML